MWPFKPNISQLAQRGKWRPVVKAAIFNRDDGVREQAIHALAEAPSEEIASLVSKVALRQTVCIPGAPGQNQAAVAARKRAADIMASLGECSVQCLKEWLYLRATDGTYLDDAYAEDFFRHGCKALARIGTPSAISVLLSRLATSGEDEVIEACRILEALSRFDPQVIVSVDPQSGSLIRNQYDQHGGVYWQPQFLPWVHGFLSDDEAASELRRLLQAAVEAANGYRPDGVTASERKRHFQPGKQSMRRLAKMGTDDDVREIAFIAMIQIGDDYAYSGLRDAAESAVRMSKRPLAELYSLLWDSKSDQARELVAAHPDLINAVIELDEIGIDVWESPKMLIDANRAASVVRRST